MEEGQDQLFQGPDGVALRFYTQAVKNNFQSEAHGLPIYDTALMVEVMVPASRESTPQFEIERVLCEEAGLDADGNRKVIRTEKYNEYKAQVEAFKSQSDAGFLKGTPLSQWPQIDAGTGATLRAAGVFTIEQLAEVADSALPKLGMGGLVLREQAKQFLQSRQFGIPTAAAAAELAHLKEENARLTSQVADQQAQIAAMSAQVQATQNTSTSPTPPTFTPPNMFAPPPPPPPEDATQQSVI